MHAVAFDASVNIHMYIGKLSYSRPLRLKSKHFAYLVIGQNFDWYRVGFMYSIHSSALTRLQSRVGLTLLMPETILLIICEPAFGSLPSLMFCMYFSNCWIFSECVDV